MLFGSQHMQRPPSDPPASPRGGLQISARGPGFGQSLEQKQQILQRLFEIERELGNLAGIALSGGGVSHGGFVRKVKRFLGFSSEGPVTEVINADPKYQQIRQLLGEYELLKGQCDHAMMQQLEAGVGDLPQSLRLEIHAAVGNLLYQAARTDVSSRSLESLEYAALMATLKQRFEMHMNRHPGLQWTQVEVRLQAFPEKLQSLQKLEDAGHEMDVFDYDQKTGEYQFITASSEVPASARNCVYDGEAEEKVKARGGACNGNAVDMVAALGADLIANEAEYEQILQNKGEKFDLSTGCWIKTPPDKRNASIALIGDCYGDLVGVIEDFVDVPDDFRGFRASLRV